ncbi:MAG: MFS transporter [Ahrensia sp.]|nr:MFS transporter [Ahrensia sp.]
MRMFPFLRENARWLAGGFLLTFFASYGQNFYVALSSGGIREDLGLSHGEFGGLYMFATLASAAAIPFAGRFADTMPIERYAGLVILGLGACMLLLANAWSAVTVFVAIAGLRMFGQGLMNQTAMTAIGRWFSLNRGKAMSTAALGHQFSESVMPISFVALAAFAGWREAWMMNAALFILIVLPAVFLLMRKPRAQSAAEAEYRDEGRQWASGEMLRDPLFWLLMPGLIAPSLIGTTVFFHQVYLTELRGWALAQFAGATPVLSVFAVVATFATGVVTDRFHSAVMLPVMLVAMAVATLALGVMSSAYAILIFMAGMGVAFGVYSVVFGAIWPELYGTRHLGAVKSLVTAIMVFVSAIGPGLSGWLIDAGVSLPSMIETMAIYAAVSAVLVAFAEPAARRRAAVRKSIPVDAAIP